MKYIYAILILISFSTLNTSCRKFVELDPPDDRLTGSTVYSTNETATSVLNGLYIRIGETNNVINSLVTPYMAMAADELKNYYVSSTSQYTQLYQNNVKSDKEIYWSTTYTLIYNCNVAIEGIGNSTKLNEQLKQQLLGEAKFMRALCYYYLVNTYGKVPLLTSPDYRLYTLAKRAEVSEVYAQIISDLQDAQTKLSKNYLNGDALTLGNERVRPTYWAATALLSRIYLYNKLWAEAESAASIVINNTALFSMVPTVSVFLKNSSESIFQLQTVIQSNYALFDARTFVLTNTIGTSSNPASISPQLEQAFEAKDKRKTDWTGLATIGGVAYRFPYKYKANTAALAASKPEYLTLLRLAEQYLIRAEARAQQNNIDGAQSDINAVRNRAGLENTTASTPSELLDAVMKERQTELFCEQGHRWFDLKRSGRIDEVMKVVTPTKGGTWESYKQLMPVPAFEIGLDKFLDQNPGYN
ncbi:RagB/SusD family nutrient uptake outer membrane protein [Pedobacter caeni]|uniref:RagB/SusD domain-containing protein n=1 Tax=Pedobacter caeni TaxID=288992 RepID=A0A1M4T3P4_9SPHI|nr:RagB/SusD family nutrient uptake outer membrane protein [Pedobacter caeni]SHE39089.1 RagB/SusD domain-containing protein [Pedobacter caeni]